MRKRQKMVLTAGILAAVMGGAQTAPLDWKYWLVGVLGLLAWLLTAWSLKEGLNHWVEWLMIPLPPVLFSLGMGLFYILLPESRWMQVFMIAVFGVGQYALLLAGNIYSVAAIRTIALLRSAHAVGFVMTIGTGFLLYNTIGSFKLPFWAVGWLTSIVSAVLLLPALWSVSLEERLGLGLVDYGVGLGLTAGVLAMAVAFWPINITVSSLFGATVLYIFLGVAQHHFSQKLQTRAVWEYVTVGVVVLVTMLATAGWGV